MAFQYLGSPPRTNMFFIYILAILSVFNTQTIALDTLSFKQSNLTFSYYLDNGETEKSYNYDFDYYKNVSKPQADNIVKQKIAKEQEVQEKIIKENLERESLAKLEIQRIQAETQKKLQLKVQKSKEQKIQTQKPQEPPVRIKPETSQIIDGEGSILRVCKLFGCDPVQVIRVMYCESGGQNKTGIFGHIGPMQFNSNTFYANAKKYGIVNPDIWNPEQQFEVSGRMFADGQAWQWSCK